FVDGEVNHEPVGRGAVPVLLVGLEQHSVTGPDDLDRPAAALAQADALGDEGGLAQWVTVPVDQTLPVNQSAGPVTVSIELRVICTVVLFLLESGQGRRRTLRTRRS